MSETKDTAKAEASHLAQSSKESAGQVAGTAKEQGQQVLSEVTSQARNLVEETKSQLGEQAGSQQQRAASNLRSLGDELSGMASSGDQEGMASQLVRQAADRVTAVAGWLEDREPGSLLEDVRDFARRKPGTFLIGAAVAGVVAGRATRAGVDLKRDQDDSSGGYSAGGTHSAGYPGSYSEATSTMPPVAPQGEYPYDAPDVGGTTGQSYAGETYPGEAYTGDTYTGGTAGGTYPPASGTTDDVWTDPGEPQR